MKIRFILLLSALILSSFIIDVRAQTANITEGCLPLNVSFSGPAGQASYFWDFMDGAVASTQNPTNTFGEAGSFIVELRDVQGGTIIGTITINVFEKPIVTIAADPTGGCAPLNTTFTSNLEGNPAIIGTGYQWSFGDGSSGSGATTNHTYAFNAANNGAPYDVGLQVSTNLTGCDVTELFEEVVVVTEQPNANFTLSPNPAVSCTAPLEVSFNNTSTSPGLTYQWDFGNGTTSTAVNPANITYTEEGSFDVTMTATNSAGCSIVITRNVNIGNPLASFSIPDTLCLNQSTSINNNSTIGAYSWDFGADATPPTSNQVNPSVTYSTPGNKTITLNVTAAGGCTGDTTITVFVQEVSPEFELTINPICEDPFQFTLTPEFMDPNASYEWIVNRVKANNPIEEILVSDEMSPSFEYINPDTTIFSKNGDIIISIEYEVTSPQGCTVSGVLLDTIYEPNALFVPDVVDGCAPVSVIFSDSSTSVDPIVSYTYIYGDGSEETFNNDNDNTHVYTDPGEYDVVLIIENDQGCRDTSYAVRIEVGAPITPDFTVTETTVCPGDTVQFTDLTNDPNIDAWHFSAEEGRASHCFQEDELFYNFDNSNGPQDITLQVEYNGCFSEVTKEDFITVNGPIARLDYLVDCESPFNIAFRDSSIDATSITWDFGDSTTSTVSDLTHLYDSTGNFMVFLTAENDMSGCPASVDSAIVYVKDIQAAFVIDSFICIGTDVPLDGSMAQDVDNRCWKGYDWHFSFDRPITTMDTVTNKMFNTDGDHTVELVTTDINGCRDTASQDVWVFSAQPDFTITQDIICIPSEILAFTDMSTADTTIVSWEWEFGDMTMGMDSVTTHTYTTSPFPTGPLSGPLVTTVDVTLRVEDIVGCPGFVTKPITIYEPTVDITTDPSPANICVGSEVEFTASDFILGGNSSPVEYDWNFGNGMTSTMQVDTALYNNSGTFVVNLALTEISTGCQSMRPITDTVRVQDFPIADFTTNVDGQDPICFPEIINFMDNSVTTSPLTADWDFGDGSSSMDLAPSITFGKGTFTVEYIASTSFGCRDTTMRDFTLVGPEGDFTIDQDLLCLGELVNFTLLNTVDIQSFRWEFGDGTVINDQANVSHEYQSGGTFTAELILTGVSGICETTIQEPITIQQVEAGFTVIDACDGPVDIVSTSVGGFIENYMYDFGDGGTSNEEDPTYTFANTGIQNVQLIVSTGIGCADTIDQTVEIFELPVPVVADVGGCENTDIVLAVNNPNGTSTYNWDPVDLVDNDGQPSVTVNLNQTTVFTVVETSVNNCEGIATGTVNIVPAIPPINDENRIVCEGDILMINLPADPFYIYEWTEENGSTDGLSCTDCPNPTVTIEGGTVTYTVVVSDANGTCDEMSGTFTYTVLEEDGIEMPNAFTPNGEINNVFNFVAANESSVIDVNVFQIYDRFGNLVYNNDNPATGWDGRSNGDLSPSDVYLYNIELLVDGCSTVPFKGDVTLIR